MGTLRTDNPRIHRVVDQLVADIDAACGSRLDGIYVMGSLARGGFSEATSDIDIGVLTKANNDNDTDRFAAIAAANQPEVENRISIFWGDEASLSGKTEQGRYPPFDRLDLLEHAVLLAGRDTRSEHMRPTYADLVNASVDFALDYLASPARIAQFRDSQLLASCDRVTLTKTVLFPARFIYLADTGEIAGNNVAAEHFAQQFHGPETELVSAAFRWRTDPLPQISVVSSLIQAGLLPLYGRFIDTYRPRLLAAGEHRRLEQLETWWQKLTSPNIEDSE